jgi:hypothetical protein
LVVFTVFEPPSPAGDRIARAERLAFVREGFHWWAAITPPVWLLVKGLWLELIVLVAGAGALGWALETAGVPNNVISMIFLALQIVIGFEASTIEASALAWRGWRELGIVTGRDELECERRFFKDWLAQEPEHIPGSEGGAPPRGLRSWTEVGLAGAKDALTRGRRVIGASRVPGT